MSQSPNYELRNGIAVIVMDDGKANAISPQAIDGLDACLTRAESEATAVVLAGRPGRFSAGFDLSVMTSGLEPMRNLVIRGAELLLRIYAFPRPVVAACSGHALAMGALLLLASDRRIGARGDFKIGLNEVKIQMPLPAFGVELSRDRLSKRHFSEAITQARIYDPDGAVDAGYLDSTEAPEALLSTAELVARDLGTLPNPAFAETKRRERSETIDRIRRTLASDITSITSPSRG